MQSLRKFDPGQLRHNVPPAPPPPPLPSPVGTPTEQVSFSINSPVGINMQHIEEDSKPLYTNFVTTGSPYLRLSSHPSSNTTDVKKSVKTSVSLPTGQASTVPPPPPLPHLPIRRHPSELLREIRSQTSKRRSGHNLGAYQGLRHVYTVEKRAFPVGRVIGTPLHVVTTQDLVRSFHKKLLRCIPFTEPGPSYPVGRVVRTPPVHVPKMKEKFSPTKKSPATEFSKKRPVGKMKKSAATAPEDELPRIPTPPPLDDIAVPMKSKKPLAKKSAGFVKRKK